MSNMVRAAKFLSFNWMRGLARDKRISVIYRFILLRLCLYRDEKQGGQCNPGYQTVADELGVYRTTVLKAVDAAVRFGWLAPPIRTRRANASFVFLFPDQEVATGATSGFEIHQTSGELAERRMLARRAIARQRPGDRRGGQLQRWATKYISPAVSLRGNA